MKRYGWLTLGISLSLGLVACGGADSDETGQVGDAGQGNFSDQLDQLRDELDSLAPKYGELDMRTTKLETPAAPGYCSAGELCIPDGVSLAKAGLQPIITALCTREITCCNAGELNYLYGAAVKTAADCEATFADLINNGLVGTVGVFGESVETIVRAAHALNDTAVLVEVDSDAVTACAASIRATVCPKDAEQAHCSLAPEVVSEPCAPSKLLKGKERAGDTCDLGPINECGEGLVCRGDPYAYPKRQAGLCAPKAAVGDRCVQQSDCDDLYCDFTGGTCQARSQEGGPCTYIDPTFEDLDPFVDEGRRTDASRTAIDCEPGLACNPANNTCVKSNCAAGSWCRSDSECDSGLSCSRTASAAIEAYSERRGSYFGVCVSGTPTCDADEDCASGHCGTNNVCSPPCDLYCNPGADCTSCAAGTYCAYTGNGSWCEPLIADGVACDPYYTHRSCTSGFCNQTCQAKVASHGACSVTEQCPAGEGCSAGTCVDAVALGEVCTPAGYNSSCGAGDYCWDADGPGAGAVLRCYALGADYDSLRDLPDGVYCAQANAWCASGWCRNDGTNWLCATPLAAGSPCDPTNSALSLCAEGAYCLQGETPSTGTCTNYRHAGEVCDPALNGAECLSGECEYTHESFVCAPDYYGEPFCRSPEFDTR